jgi:SAM-dependent methyltransferase
MTSGMPPADQASNPWSQGWTDEIAQRWIRNEAVMDRAISPFGDAALRRADPRPGERVLDVGCGCGPTTFALAERVGESGRVVGVDVAAPMVALGQSRAAGRANVRFTEADAQTAAWEDRYQLVYSRFGVMFFADPAAAFRNLATALALGGRLVFVCWRAFEENPWMAVPFAALRRVIPDAPGSPAEGPGPFSLAEPAHLEALLVGAGLREISIEPLDHPVDFGPDLDSAVQLAVSSGPTGRAMLAADERTRAAARLQLATALIAHLQPAGVSLAGAVWIVSARL